MLGELTLSAYGCACFLVLGIVLLDCFLSLGRFVEYVACRCFIISQCAVLVPFGA